MTQKDEQQQIRQLRIRLQILALKIEALEDSGYLTAPLDIELTNLARDGRAIASQQEKL